jgi:hypothetical protein
MTPDCLVRDYACNAADNSADGRALALTSRSAEYCASSGAATNNSG